MNANETRKWRQWVDAEIQNVNQGHEDDPSFLDDEDIENEIVEALIRAHPSLVTENEDEDILINEILRSFIHEESGRVCLEWAKRILDEERRKQNE